ncbi:MAG TPA: hypothetical protein VN442_02915 [Bryobacteraceae bacterium]|nr:hypothetical protein [Bryobacteraceae bacterium]
MRYNALSMHRREDLESLIGRSPDQLTVRQRTAFAGTYVAFEIYTPARLPLRRIEAAGASVADCVRQLRARGLDPAGFEFTLLAPPF